ncbi:aminoglycoside phosphotransferase family protein [Streptomyces sp. NPDC005202]|uniref:phosphotransferase family protein n=1 Tax=Streptomyces sp. NPDC005202 TaxID=3157021 RepID=UPI0033AF59E3
MTPTRASLTRADLAPLARAAVGPQRTLVAVARLPGGSKKGVYRLAFDDGTTAIAYVWSPREDYWSQPDADPRDPFSHASGLGLFTAAHDRLSALGIRTPHLLLADPDRTYLPAEAAVVEDVAGGSLEDALHRDPDTARAALERLAETLGALGAHQGPGFGKVALVDNGGTSHGGSCEQLVTDRALGDIDEVAARDPRAAQAREVLREAVGSLAAEVRSRSRHPLVHGELGPDHVLLTPDGDPAIVDIEGLMYFDAEWEHVFLRLRFGRHYDALRAPGLDESRLRLYTLAMHLSLVAGPLRLLDGDFPDAGVMRAIAEYNLVRALDLIGR